MVIKICSKSWRTALPYKSCLLHIIMQNNFPQGSKYSDSDSDVGFPSSLQSQCTYVVDFLLMNESSVSVMKICSSVNSSVFFVV